MRGIQIKEYVKGPDDLKVVDLPDLAPEEAEYVIKVHAAAGNFFDILQIQGKYQHQPPFPWTAGAEFSGVVVSVPTNPETPPLYPVGTRVFGASQGAYAEYVHAPERALLPVPEGWSFEDAAGLFVTAPTSYSALVQRANIKRGDWVLVHAAAGGVGLAAVQIAKAFGATVIATASTPRKLDVAKRFGADHVLSYNDPSWPAQVKELTPESRGVDIVYDPVGLVDKSTKCVAWNGRILIIGFAGGAIEKVAMNKVLLKNISLVGLAWGAHALHQPEMVPVVWRGVLDLVRKGELRGTQYTDEAFVGLDRVKDGLKALGGRDTWGKVIIKIAPEDKSSKL
ncbi:Alcohol dehydrogenase superfamily, zinc-containing [Cordyceps fumosorosea ARSEF 2679]|uniref:Alcohol dehydrogenase superfamily, zinc-containing n=1 Tax=Cordyceps fumosorosea (strain ARSEF 2679) TaxID=1081104 RepID=A0A167V166_CORFA|nr:Alcohol dehydrogenase superfamily, zinc-containing [Cordyceps fumosorosea ARSEF 2679]OAA62114.1 Alcohol dehydrogenase superfamily, zinc-containing [Cordyceps fumosorosea ARSEF 2679]